MIRNVYIVLVIAIRILALVIGLRSLASSFALAAFSSFRGGIGTQLQSYALMPLVFGMIAGIALWVCAKPLARGITSDFD